LAGVAGRSFRASCSLNALDASNSLSSPVTIHTRPPDITW
jgi:hypothetical protein